MIAVVWRHIDINRCHHHQHHGCQLWVLRGENVPQPQDAELYTTLLCHQRNKKQIQYIDICAAFNLYHTLIYLKGRTWARGDIEMLNILVWKFENKLFSGEVTVGFYELNNSREILDVPNNTILRKKGRF